MDDGGSPYIWLIVVLLLAAVGFIAWLWYKMTASKKENLTEEEIISMVNEGHEQGVILASEIGRASCRERV